MKYTYKIEELDCPHCAAKVEEAISKLPGVEKANVNYLSEKIVVVSEMDEDDLFENIVKIAKRVEPDAVVTR